MDITLFQKILIILISIVCLVICLLGILLVGYSLFIVPHVCDDDNLETKAIVIEYKFIDNRGLGGDHYHFIDENGVDYEIWGSHKGARYVKLKLNQSYQIKVNVKNGNIVCEEIPNGN